MRNTSKARPGPEIAERRGHPPDGLIGVGRKERSRPRLKLSLPPVGFVDQVFETDDAIPLSLEGSREDIIFEYVFEYNDCMSGGTEIEASPVDYAFDQLSTSLDHLVKVVEDGGLDHCDHLQQVRFLQGFESLRNRLSLVDHRVISHGLATGLPEALVQPNMAQVLTSAVRISAAEAARRVRAAELVGGRLSALRVPLDPIRPTLAAAQRAGEVNTEQVAVIVGALASVDRPGFDPADIEAGERLLSEHALTFGPRDLRMLADRVVEAMDPDGTRPNDELNSDRRHFHLRPTRDGAYVGEGRLTGTAGAKLLALLGPLAKPRTDLITLPDGQVRPRLDPRTRGQRMHDALEDVCDRLLRAGGLPESGGTPATVVVTIDLDHLVDRVGCGVTSDGMTLSTGQIIELANQADIVPVVLATSGAVLDLGRSRRIATANQTMALIARDGGCSFPGCAHPPEFCERHHIVEWINGGETKLTNLTLLCRYHHHHHFLTRGWTCEMNGDGLPEWTAPAWLDRTRTPIINARIRARTGKTQNRSSVIRRT